MSTAADDALRDWTIDALATLRRESARSADTHLLRLTFPGFAGIDFYFKDEAAHPSGSLKHRLARSLYLYALCNGRLRPGQAAVDASSGSTAISEAWFARLLGIDFTAVMPACTAPRDACHRARACTSPGSSTRSQRPPSACTSAILRGAVQVGMTAVNSSPSRRANQASEIAVLPDDASTTRWPGRSRPLHSA